MRYYENYVNPISYGLFYWINWLLKLGYDHPLELKDLGSLPENHTTKHNYQKLRKVFKQEMVRTTHSLNTCKTQYDTIHS